MYFILSLFCLVIACVSLLWMSAVDFRKLILPNKLVALFAVCGVGFHASTWDAYGFLSLMDIAFGIATGGGFMLAVRWLAGRYYVRDVLGLGDVKLIAAGGLWLGPEHILIAISVGACAGAILGIFYNMYLQMRFGQSESLGKTVVPAGPGFALGIILLALWTFRGYGLF